MVADAVEAYQSEGKLLPEPRELAVAINFQNQSQLETCSEIQALRPLLQQMHSKPSDRYLLFVKWSDEDDAFIGGVCHDRNRIAAYATLVEIVEDDISSRLA